MTARLPERVREGCARVVESARSVQLDRERLEALAAELASETVPPAQLDPAHHYRGDEASTLAFVLCLDAVNFGSGWFPVLRKRDRLSGYRTVATCLKERFEKSGPWSAAELRRLDTEACAEAFGQADGHPDALGLMSLFARALSDLGAWLEERHGGRFEGPVEEAGGSAARLAEALAEMPLYRDEVPYDGFVVPFYKRAQLTPADLAAAFGGEGPGRFHDLDRLTCFADNLVPHVLRREGALRYVPELAAHVDASQPLASGSPEEVEIRASAVVAVDALVDGIRARGGRSRACDVDFLLWTRGQRPSVKAHPRHRTRCTFY